MPPKGASLPVERPRSAPVFDTVVLAPAAAQPEGAAPGGAREYLWVLERHAWKIAAFVVAVTLMTLLVSLRLTPVYESTVTVDIDRQSPTGVVGQEAAQMLRTDADQFLATQAKLMQSDSVLRPVASRFRLLDRAEESGSLQAAARIDPEAPILLRRLKVTRPANTYLLQVSYRSTDRQLASDVANAVAQSYLEHTYQTRYKAATGLSRFMERQIEELRAKMEGSSDALSRFEKELSIINPEQKTNILAARLLELNTELTRAQSDRVARQAAYSAVSDGSAESAHVSSQSESLKKLSEEYNVARRRYAEVKTHYGPNHPEHIAARAAVQEIEKMIEATVRSIRDRVRVEFTQASDRERMLDEALKETKKDLDNLNARSFQYQAIKREADEDRKLYEELLRKIREATINASFQTSTARIADPARPGRKPVFPNIPLNTLLALVFSSLIAIGAAILSDVVDDTVRDPEQIKRTLGAEVIGSLPEVKDWRRQLATAPAQTLTEAAALAVPSNGYSNLNTYEEAIRTLRNSILLADFDRRLRTVLVTSASPSEGKSTIAMHLAIAHSRHHRTLVIDGDLRRPSVHKRFNLRNDVGLSDVLLEREAWQDTLLHAPGMANLDILPAGSISPRRAADLVGRGLERVLDEAGAIYDLVVVDAPPLLGFAEPLQMATAVDGVLVVARAGETSRRSMGAVLRLLERLRANVIGIVLNEVTRQASGSYYYYNHYRKYYGRAVSADG